MRGGLASILDKTIRDAIRARIDQLKVADPRDLKMGSSTTLYRSCWRNQGWFFLCSLFPRLILFNSWGRIPPSHRVSKRCAQCAVVFLLFIIGWKPTSSMSCQVFTTPSQAAPYGWTQNSLWSMNEHWHLLRRSLRSSHVKLFLKNTAAVSSLVQEFRWNSYTVVGNLQSLWAIESWIRPSIFTFLRMFTLLQQAGRLRLWCEW